MVDLKGVLNHGILYLFLIILGVSSCKSDLSNGKLDKLSLIYTRIEINQSPTDKADNSVAVALLDNDGNRISNDSILIFVNGIEEKLTHKQGLYYTNVFIGMTEQTEPHVTSAINKDEKIIKIKSNGSFKVSKVEYKEAKAKISGIEFNFRTTRNGTVNPELLKNSHITIKTLIEKYVSFEE
jgi:hypothetical protein